MIWSLKVEYKRIDKVKIQHRVEWKICLKAKNENITQDQNKNTTQKKKKKTHGLESKREIQTHG